MNVCSARWATPTSILLAGPSGTGKTHFLYNLLKVKEKLFDPPPKTVLYFYKIYQDKYDEMLKEDPSIFFIDQLPQNVDALKSLVEPHKERGSILVFDDLEDELVKNIDMFRQLWTVLSHHLNTTPIAVLHNLYAKNICTVSINTHRFVLTRSLRDSSQISFLSRQCYPNVKNFLPSVYAYCMKLQDYPYLVLNFSPGKESSNYIKVSTRIFENEGVMMVFTENECYNTRGGNPYEKLVLINHDLYRFLTRDKYSEKISSDLTPISHLSNSSHSSSNNNVRIYNEQNSKKDSEDVEYTGRSTRSPPLTNDKESTPENPWDVKPPEKMLNNDKSLNKTINQEDQSQSEQPKPFSTPATNKVTNHKTNLTSKRSKPFVIPPISKLFKKNVKEVETSSKNRSTPPLKISIAKINTKTPNKIINKPSEKMNIESNLNVLEDVSEKPRTNDLSTVKLKPLVQKNLKRKAHTKINRELHPFKAMRLNRGDKRKNTFYENLNKKNQKTSHPIFRTSDEGYQKWNV